MTKKLRYGWREILDIFCTVIGIPVVILLMLFEGLAHVCYRILFALHRLCDTEKEQSADLQDFINFLNSDD